MTESWQGKTVIITGAGSGIGRALSNELASRGAIVYVTALSLEECKPVVDEISKKGFHAFPAKLDVTNWQEFNSVIQSVTEQHGKLDVLINNAGRVFVGEFFDMTEHSIEELIHTNLTAVTIGCLYAYRAMKEQAHGTIINISSMGGFTPTPSMTVYAATKHALLGLTNSLATEADIYGVKIKAVCFGLIQSELFRKGEVKRGDEKTVQDMLPIKALPAEKAAKLFADQIQSNKRIIFLPFYARIMWWVYRFFPSILFKGAPDTMKRYRQLVEKNTEG